MTAALEGGEWSAARPGTATLYPRERPRTHFTGDWVVSRVGLDDSRSTPPFLEHEGVILGELKAKNYT